MRVVLGIAPEPHLVVQPADLEALVRRKNHEPRHAPSSHGTLLSVRANAVTYFALRAHGDELLHAVQDVMIPLAHRAQRRACGRVRIEGEGVVAASARLRDGDADAIERVCEVGGDHPRELFGRRHGDEARDPLPVVAVHLGDGGRAGGEFLHDDALGEDAGPVAPVRFGHAQGVKAERGAPLHQVVGELVLPVGSLLEFGHLWQHLLHREFSCEELQAFLFLTQFEIHAVSLSVYFPVVG